MNYLDHALADEVQAVLDEYLDSVDRTLAEAGISRSERRSICDEVEAQAREMAWAEGSPPSKERMAAVVAELDSPEDYLDGIAEVQPASVVGKPTGNSKIHPFALVAIAIPAIDIFLLNSPLHPKGDEVFIPFGVVMLLSTVFAGLAIRDIRRQPDHYFGTALAVAGVVALPLILFNLWTISCARDVNPFGMRKQYVNHQLILGAELAEREKGASFDSDNYWRKYGSGYSPTLTLTSSERWIVKYFPLLEFLYRAVPIGAAVLSSILLFILLCRSCRPRSATCG